MYVRRGKGRPRKNPDSKRDKLLAIHLTDEEIEVIKRSAKYSNMSVADYILSMIDENQKGDGDYEWPE